MRDSTTIRVSPAARDALRALADEDGITLDAEVVRLTRAERQRRMGLALSGAAPTEEDRSWLAAAGDAVRDDAGR